MSGDQKSLDDIVYAVWRMDENGTTSLVRDSLTQPLAEKIVNYYLEKGSKHMYWSTSYRRGEKPMP